MLSSRRLEAVDISGQGVGRLERRQWRGWSTGGEELWESEHINPEEFGEGGEGGGGGGMVVMMMFGVAAAVGNEIWLWRGPQKRGFLVVLW